MQKYIFRGSVGKRSLELVENSSAPEPGPDEVVVAVKAVSLNFRDLLIADGVYGSTILEDVIPVSDGAGEVVAVGSNVSHFQRGDRVLSCFFPFWESGPVTRSKVSANLGGSLNGMLAELACVPASALMPLPDTLEYAEGAALPCAALTAWRALVEIGKLRAGDVVLLQGTGGVSTFALQFAKAMGARVIQTSSSSDKLETARSMGADYLVNYRERVDWDHAAREITGGEGVDIVIEVGGAGTLERAIRATRMGGTIAAIGLVAGTGEIDPLPIIGGGVTFVGFMVGSRQTQHEMLRAIETNEIKPLITQRFTFDDASAAFQAMQDGVHGKLVIEV